MEIPIVYEMESGNGSPECEFPPQVVQSPVTKKQSKKKVPPPLIISHSEYKRKKVAVGTGRGQGHSKPGSTPSTL